MIKTIGWWNYVLEQYYPKVTHAILQHFPGRNMNPCPNHSLTSPVNKIMDNTIVPVALHTTYYTMIQAV